MAAPTLEITPRQALDTLGRGLSLTDDDLATAVGANRRTVQRWRDGTAHPQQAARARLAALIRFEQRLRDTFSSPDAARTWFHAPSRYMGGITPAEAVKAGRADRAEAALEALDSGVFL
jgi:uncharacterized protein (DUF2384 family)